MGTPSFRDLSRRERQILDVVYERQRATAAEVRDALEDPPSYSSVRTFLRLLEEKGFLRHEQDGPRYVFIPVIRRDRARASALRHLLKTFFDDSPQEVVTALLSDSKTKPSKDELDAIAEMIKRAKKEGR